MPKTRQIALAFPMGVAVYQELLHGIMEYSREHAPWTFIHGTETLAMSMLSLAGWRGDGVIANICTRSESRAAARLRIPVINLSGVLPDAGVPRVMNDHWAIGRVAAEHLLGCGFRRFAYYGTKHAWYSAERGRGFVERVREEGWPCDILAIAGSTERKGSWHSWWEELRKWLRRLQPPVAVMAASDVLARMVADTCRQLGLHVPHDVGLVGVGNDPLICDTSPPTLTSVARNGREIGRRVAQLLDRLMAGRRPPKADVLVPPAGVVARQSTDVVAVDDPELSQAVRFIRDHLGRPFTVEDLLGEVPVSRRWLEYRFRERFGRSPYEYICEARVERAKQLLLGAERLSAEEIARACGFSGARNLRLVFERLTGTTPAQYRRREAAQPARRGSARSRE